MSNARRSENSIASQHSYPVVHVKQQPDKWILSDIANQLSAKLEWSVGKTVDTHADINYFVNYHRYEETSGLSAAFFTHREHWYGRYERMWWDVLENVDLAVFQSEKYRSEATDRIPKLNSVVISPGFDSSKFTPKPLRIGVVGRSYGNGRKGEDLLVQVATKFPGVDWVITGGNWGVRSKRVRSGVLPALYRSLDYLLIPSRTEGGPMPAIEALACGVPVISADVGWMQELPHIEFENGSVDSLHSVIAGLVKKREVLVDSVANRTWTEFASLHALAFVDLVRKSAL